MVARLRRGILCISLILLAALAVLAAGTQQPKIPVRVIGNEIFVEERPGVLRQLTHDGKPKEHVSISPDGSKIIYHGRFDAYSVSRPQPVVFNALDVRTGRLLHRIPVRWDARYVSRVDWVDPETVVVEGEGAFLAVLDVERGMHTHTVYGTNPTFSPDRTKIAFQSGRIPRYGPVAPQRDSDDVHLELLSIKRNSTWTIYPVVQLAAHLERRVFEDLSDRHHLKSLFAWSGDSQKLTFVEQHKESVWLVVLTVQVKESGVRAVPERFRLPEELATVTGIEWLSSGDTIKITTPREVYTVDAQGKVRAVKP